MVAAFLQEDLAAELREIFSGFLLKNPQDKPSKINVFLQNLPIPEALNQKDIPAEQLENGLADDLTEEDPYPYIQVRIMDGEIKGAAEMQEVSIVLLVGIYEPDYNKSGHKDILNIFQKIYERFAKNPILAKKYTISYPISWTLQEEESYPYYFGGMNLIWNTHSIRREMQIEK